MPSDTGYDAFVHLSYNDISVVNPSSPSIVRVVIKQSKQTFLEKASASFWVKPAPISVQSMPCFNTFCVGDSTMALCLSFSTVVFLPVEALRLTLARSGIDDSKYSGHSFRIGAATTAASKGVEDCVITTLGRWSSLAYLQ